MNIVLEAIIIAGHLIGFCVCSMVLILGFTLVIGAIKEFENPKCDWVIVFFGIHGVVALLFGFVIFAFDVIAPWALTS